MENEVLTTSEVAKVLGVHTNTVRAMVDDGRLKGFKTKGTQGHWRFKKEDVLALKEEKIEDNNSPKSLEETAIILLDEIPAELIANDYENHGLWSFVNRNFGIERIFGTYGKNIEYWRYLELINDNSLNWMGGGISNVNLTAKHDEIPSVKKISYALGTLKEMGIFELGIYHVTALLIVTTNDNQKWIVDGTLQRFFHNRMEKGLVVLPYEQAKHMYLNLKEYSNNEYCRILTNEDALEDYRNETETLDSLV